MFRKVFLLNGILILIMALVSPVLAAKGIVNKNALGVAIDGYDPVAYFSEQKPVKGSGEFSYAWDGADWYFSSQENKDMFVENPEKYAPQYGGFCAFAMSKGSKAGVDPKAWTVYQGKLYLNYNTALRDRQWLPYKDALIKRADVHWRKI